MQHTGVDRRVGGGRNGSVRLREVAHVEHRIGDYISPRKGAADQVVPMMNLSFAVGTIAPAALRSGSGFVTPVAVVLLDVEAVLGCVADFGAQVLHPARSAATAATAAIAAALPHRVRGTGTEFPMPLQREEVQSAYLMRQVPRGRPTGMQ